VVYKTKRGEPVREEGLACLPKPVLAGLRVERLRDCFLAGAILTFLLEGVDEAFLRRKIRSETKGG